MIEKALELRTLISTPKKILITTHRGPDGDAMGSSLAMYHFLIQLGHDVTVITPNEYAEFLHWLPANKKVIAYNKNIVKANQITNESEIIFLLDISNTSRLSEFQNTVVGSSATKILIDHHQDPDTNAAKLIFSDTSASSTAELLYEIIEAMEMQNYLNKEVATCLYVGMMTDTGSFKFASTTAKTHAIIAKLILAGVENAKVHDLVYDNSSESSIKLLGYCLNKKLLWIYLFVLIVLFAYINI